MKRFSFRHSIFFASAIFLFGITKTFVAWEKEFVVESFSAIPERGSIPSAWKISDKRNTDYSIIRRKGKSALKILSKKGSSVFYRKVNIDCERFSLFSISWGTNDFGQFTSGKSAAVIYFVFDGDSTQKVSFQLKRNSSSGSHDSEAQKLLEYSIRPVEGFKRRFNKEPVLISEIGIVTQNRNEEDPSVIYVGDMVFKSN